MKRFLAILVLVLILPMTLAGSDQFAQARLKKFTKSSTVPQQQYDFHQAQGFKITATSPDQPFTFRKVRKIRKISRITITLRLFDGETASGEKDEGDLTLALDGIDTGLILDGFRLNKADTQTISGVPINEPQIRAALRVDGKLHATIIDADPGDNALNGTSQDNTTLVLKGKSKDKAKR